MGWVRSNLASVRRMKARLGGDAFILHLEDGSRVKFRPDAVWENFGRNAERLRALYRGEEVPPAHPFGVALARAINLPAELAHAAEAQRRLDRQVEVSNEE